MRPSDGTLERLSFERSRFLSHASAQRYLLEHGVVYDWTRKETANVWRRKQQHHFQNEGRRLLLGRWLAPDFSLPIVDAAWAPNSGSIISVWFCQNPVAPAIPHKVWRQPFRPLWQRWKCRTSAKRSAIRCRRAFCCLHLVKLRRNNDLLIYVSMNLVNVVNERKKSKRIYILPLPTPSFVRYY